MATGDAPDMLARIKRVVPSRWFAYAAPLRDAVLGGLADQLAWVYSLIAFAKLQTRISTATGFFLDLIAFDYFGRFIRRRINELDAAFMARIKKELVRERVTRKGMIAALTDLTGKAPLIIEPWNPYDCGALSTPYLALCNSACVGGAGFVGSTVYPSQVLITAYMPGLQGVPNISGFNCAPGGVGVGSMAVISRSMITGAVTSNDVYSTIEATKPTGTICWVRLH